ncbi:MAG: hypothetical protein QOJ13_2221 [Gaiellales bacterium]|jgi:hypothetical protein|nr:hypothetical protein [Gaiellales bacterium]
MLQRGRSITPGVGLAPNATTPEEAPRREATARRVGRADGLLVLAALFGILAVDFSGIGADAWPFVPGEVRTSGTLGWVVQLAQSEWNVGVLRAGVVAAMAFVALCAFVRASNDGLWRKGVLVGIAVVAVSGAVLPAVVMQLALREGTAPWFYTNDSTYQIELAGDLVRNGQNPYDHDYSSSGMERFYTMDGTAVRRPNRFPALSHFAYFPGSVALATAWRNLPAPWNDFRLLVALSTVLLIPAGLLFPGPFGARLAVGSVLACNPVAIRLAWFGNADAPCVLALVVAFGLASRGRWRSAAAALAVAILMKQFAIAAVPFLVLMLLLRGNRRDLTHALAVGSAVIAAAFLPFLLASPAGLWQDTITYGTGTFHVVSYGLAGLFVRLGVANPNAADYPFFPLMLACWLPITAYAVRAAWRSKEPWLAGAGFTLSIFTMIVIARVFQTSYIVYPLSGALITLLLALEQFQAAQAQRAGGSALRLAGGMVEPTPAPARLSGESRAAG